MAISNIWTLLAGGVEKSLANWGVTAATLQRNTQAVDLLDLSFAGAGFDKPLLFAFEQKLTLKRAGQVWFVGVVTETPRMARPSDEMVRYRVSGPWYWLAETPYEQPWAVYNPDTESPDNADQSRVILGANQAGAPITTGQQITDILNYATEAGAPFQIGTIDPAITVPTDEATDPSCAEAIQRMLRWHPDVVTWFDYSTSPHPTLHMRARGNLASLSRAVAGGGDGIEIRERPDLMPSVVAIKYQVTSEVDGVAHRSLEVDKYPLDQPLKQPRARVMTVNLQGNQVSYLQQYIESEEIDEDSLDWWKNHVPFLKESRVKNLSFVGSSPPQPEAEGGEVYDNELLAGAIADWMGKSTSVVRVRGEVNYDIETTHNGKTVVEQRRNEVLNVRVTSTNAATGWYAEVGNFVPGEPVPTGLAQAFYTACAALQWQGSFDWSDKEVTVSPLGRVLNLTGGLAAWATMNALVFSSTDDLGGGRTSVRFGAVPYLSPTDRLAILRANRRRQSANRYERSAPQSAGGARVPGSVMPKENSGTGGSEPRVHTIAVVPAEGETPAKTVTVKPAQVAVASVPSNLTAIFREIAICPDGVNEKRALVLCTEPYDPPEP